ncbi:hypothetical protein HPB47_021413 [Ixodes persulcatus]|uniref:Uncharacterized protein n=1 Tax=Ixodes persulcatus TaxID=34615 RepID=A0AC60QCT8_IXOPE|nr:hypothetical protein HPB47_021413 [Ixodes persulcatus]
MIQDVDKELSNEEITPHLRSNIKVGAVRRPGKSSTVKVTFRGKILPTHVLLGHVRHPVHPFQERPIQCLNCFGFGHERRKKLGEIQAYSKSKSVGFHVAKWALEYEKHFPEMKSTRAGSNATKEPTVTELKNSGEKDMEET